MTANGIINAYSEDCTLLLNNTRVTISSDGHFEVKLPLAEGANRFTLEVVQKGKTCDSITIEIDRLSIGNKAIVVVE